MAKRILTDVLGRESYAINSDPHSTQLGLYYFDFQLNPAKLNRLIADFDSEGIPLNTTYIDVAEKKLHYYPITIGQFGLAVYNDYIRTKNEEQKQYFLRISRWFYNNRKTDTKFGFYWLTDVEKPEYHVFSPWKSAFSQSRAISILLRAWQISGETKYYEAAKLALEPFKYDISDGGVSAYAHNGHPFYEEYVAAEPTMVLDGHIFSLFGLYDFVRAVSSDLDPQAHKLAANLFHKGIDSLIYWLPEFDIGFWLRFNLCKMSHYPEIDPCTIGYLRLILRQLSVLFLITENKSIIQYKRKFEQYDVIKNYFKVYRLKYKALQELNRV